ncbi:MULTISPECIES: trypsin-like serine peptidase [Bacillus]|uniref:trypsin-like serine peptidase n=1 Tax=Bacillus TaxID=1386 RepID=UPI000B5DA9D8|nr:MULTISPECIES: serine protease [Bacillus]OXB97356.1 serine protease [Bacillus sp. M13(2017)]PER90304.1 serine protease [Bacillus cereus]QCY64788.1 serine protease [Bacillus thuringiensis]
MVQDEKSKIVDKTGEASAESYSTEGSIGGLNSQTNSNSTYVENSRITNWDEIVDLPTIEEVEGMMLSNNSGISEKLPTIEALENLIPETTCGADERSQALNTKIYPWRAVCDLIITLEDGRRARGTGWLNGRGTVITAGHCVFSPTLKKWHKSITVIPGRNGNEKPYGEITSTQLSSVKGWTENQDQNYDYGAIILPSHIGDTTGYLGIKVYQDSELNGVKANISGYPGDKPHTQWFMYDKITNVDERKIYYNIDTEPGHSGSPLWIDEPNGKYFAVGVHAYGGCPNSATRINHAVYNNLLTWKQRGDQ